MTPDRRILLISLFAFLALGSCAVGPDYVKPAADVPAAYKEKQGLWKPATPQDAADKGEWWRVYNDATLNDLESQLLISNQNLKAAEAAYRQSKALSDAARASFFPVLTGNASATRSKPASGSPRNSFNASLSAAWEPDLWGSIRRDVESTEANAEASAADLANARLSAQAELAVDYFDLRVQDEIKNLLDQTVSYYQESLKITQNQYKAGIVAKTDVMEAETQLKSTQANAINLGVHRAQLEHAIAVLIGKPPGEFSIAPTPLLAVIPAVPPGVPSTLLERRPDIASAERQVAAANAQVGVAIGAFFPDITLGGSYGFASTALSTLLTAGNNLWSVGPSLALTLFDGGERSAEIDRARAVYDQSVANYRQTVLASFQDVEDQIAAQRILAEQADAEAETVKAAQQAQKLVNNQYKAGIIPYTNVIVAEASALSAQQSALGIRRDRLIASVNLIKALGGGWTNSQIPMDAAAAMNAKETAPANDVAPAKSGDSFLGMGKFF
jgi:NodT family efflux transporter outer membrane factor (OMF) lipoprotein